MDFTSWERWELQEKCRESKLYAGGTKSELNERLVGALLPGCALSVWFPACSKWRECFIYRTFYDDKFEVMYSDNNTTTVHNLRETHIMIAPPAEEEAEAEDSEDDDAAHTQARLWDHIADWGKKELQEYCRCAGLPTNCTKDELQQLVLQNLAAHLASEAEEPDAAEVDLSGYSRKELQGMLRERDLYAGGSRDEQEQRLREALAEELAEDEDEDEDEDEAEVDLSGYSRKELQGMLRERDLYAGGSRDEQEQRLREAIELEELAAAVDLSDCSRRELQGLLRGRGLYTGGSRDEVEQRLREAFAKEIGQGEDEDEDEEASDVEDLAANMANLNTHDRPAYASPQGAAGLGVGRKRALIVGCSYRNTRQNELPGSLNDAYAIKGLLVNHFRFPDSTDCIMLLTDDHEDRFRLPTRRNILKGFEWLMRDLHTGDSLFFYFSGHGGSVPDPTGEEPSGYNQTICPCDCDREEAITDSVIHKMLVKELPMNVTLHALLDSCHSGTVMNLPFNAVLKNGRLEGWNEEYAGQSWKKTTAGGMAMQFSASRHDQSAYESQRTMSSKTSSIGAATYAFTKAIEHHKGVWGFDIVYGELLGAMHDELLADKRFKGQEPTLSASSSFDIMSHRTKLRL